MASPSIAHDPAAGITVGVDTHGEVHVAAAFTSDLGRPLGHLEIPTTPAGYGRLLRWAQAFGDATPRFGVEGTGAYGAGLARHLRRAGCTVIEINRPNRQTRHARGKSDPIDAEAAARAVLSGEACLDPQERRGQGGHDPHPAGGSTLGGPQHHADHQPDPLPARHGIRLISASSCARSPARTLIETLAAFRPGPITTPTAATKMTLRVSGAAPSVPRRGDRHVERRARAAHPGGRARAVRHQGDRTRRGRSAAGGRWATTPTGCAPRPASRTSAASRPCLPHPARRPAAIGSTAAATARPTMPSGASSSVASAGTSRPRTTWPAEPPRASPRRRSSAASSATSRVRSSTSWLPRLNLPEAA